MSKDIELDDLADQLLVIDRRTVAHLFELENCSDCVALYIFFYKTAKWQGTKSIKANDLYIRKCLNWGAKRVTTTKKLLEDAGLIRQVAKRDGGKITGHYIEVEYLLHHNTPKPLVDEATCGFQETNTNKSNIKCLISKDEMLIGESPRTQRSLDIDEAFVIWEEEMGYPLQANKTDRRSLNAILNRKGMDLDKLRLLVKLVARSQSDKYKRFSITCYTDLMYKTNDLIAWAKEKQAQQQSESKVAEV